MSLRPKRKAADKRAVIVELSSDSEEDNGRKRAKHDDDFECETAQRQRVKVSKTQRWPSESNASASSKSHAKSTRKGKATTSKSGRENLPPNTEDCVELPQRNEEADGCVLSNEENPSTVRTQTHSSEGRSSRRPWNIYELLGESTNIDERSSRNIIQLFENENTIPFICRYRRDLIRNDITPEKLREIKNTYSEIVQLKKRAETIITQLSKDKVLNDTVRNEMLCAKTTEELEFLYAPYKPATKGSLADRAKALGLEKYADYILNGTAPTLKLESIVDRSNPELDSVEKIVEGICHIISHNFSKNTDVLEELRRLQKVHRISLMCTKQKSKEKSGPSTGDNRKNDESKYEQYFKFENLVRYIKPHQVLAINRGEKAKFLSVKIMIPDRLRNDILYFIRKLYMSQGIYYPLRVETFEKSFEECYTKKLTPFLTRQIRSDLNDLARKASIEVFAKNLKQLLLISPLKGERILGIDPGFTNGCKLALISETADVLDTDVIHPHSRHADPEEEGEKLCKMLARNRCKFIALGNGTACRETEFWLSKLFEKGILDANRVKYSIVSEQGASIYSCSDVAKKEFPNLDVNLISAASIARRLNDPLSEYVKIEPRHIGVGMYQHDINEKILNESLNEVVSECVSFVGVDLNTASLSVLKHIAGLTEKRAEKIIQHRLDNGPFKTRKDLLKVKTIGEKTFLQCAGFIRIEPKSVGGTVDNLLDCTWVHPESYDVTAKIISKCELKVKDIGTPEFIHKVQEFTWRTSTDELSKEFKIPKERIEVILEALQRELFKDYRSDFDKKPLFKQGITRIADLEVGSVVTGAVTNITHFGAFTDIGVETDGLIHTSNMNGMILNIGDRVEAVVMNVDVKRRRINLRLEGLAI